MDNMMTLKETFIFLLFIACCSASLQDDRCQDKFGSDLTKNFALSGTASQSSVYNNGQPARLIDGDTNPYFGNNSCSETNVGDNSWWEVQLQNSIYITSVTITSRADPYWPYSDFFQIDPCTSGILANDGGTKTYPCQEPYPTTTVKIVLPGTGKRLSLCEVQVHGREMEFFDKEVNYALKQPAKLSSTYLNWVASKAVDGNRNVNMQLTTCVHTVAKTFDWWRVDLGKSIVVYAVTVTNRIIEGQRLSDFEIFVSPSIHIVEEKGPTCDGRRGIVKGATRTIFCQQPLRGRHVALVSRLTEALQFCEVSVQGWEEECIAPRPMGMESFRILNSQISSSSSFSVRYPASNGRLNNKRWVETFPAWIPSDTDASPWLQVDFLWIVTITEILTQGRHSAEQYADIWTKTYMISYGSDGADFQYYAQNGIDKD
ncbi:uncharacterized protein LOC114517662 [Dendronephthya gigantea]|uniref:uncharacterized protein LOC114517662 n=1 Tax=Dendronephthya gigantea TaxID=151771 RepID=UPI00106AF86A|nr:uncharacterized protein LOC114517662 [Dendronephthya gigantea]